MPTVCPFWAPYLWFTVKVNKALYIFTNVSNSPFTLWQSPTIIFVSCLACQNSGYLPPFTCSMKPSAGLPSRDQGPGCDGWICSPVNTNRLSGPLWWWCSAGQSATHCENSKFRHCLSARLKCRTFTVISLFWWVRMFAIIQQLLNCFAFSFKFYILSWGMLEPYT